MVDPLGSLVVALILVGGAGKLLWDATLVLLEAAPAHLPARTVRDLIKQEPGVVDVTDLRIWTLGAGHDAVSGLVRTEGAHDGLAARISERLRRDLRVEQVTIQVSSGQVSSGQVSSGQASSGQIAPLSPAGTPEE